MPNVRDVVSRKGQKVVTVAPDCTVLETARIMVQDRIGGVLVCHNDVIVGIFTERDVLRRVVAEQRIPAETLVSEVMSRELVTVTSMTTLDDCSALMTQRRIRHLPVVDEKALQGIITPGDLLAFRCSEQESVIESLHHYVHDLR